MLTNEEILHVASLARIKVEPEEVETYRRELGSILEYVAKLQELGTEGVPELAHGAGLVNVFREDAVENAEPSVRKAIIAAFPMKEGDLLKVPAVFADRTE